MYNSGFFPEISAIIIQIQELIIGLRGQMRVRLYQDIFHRRIKMPRLYLLLFGAYNRAVAGKFRKKISWKHEISVVCHRIHILIS